MEQAGASEKCYVEVSTLLRALLVCVCRLCWSAAGFGTSPATSDNPLEAFKSNDKCRYMLVLIYTVAFQPHLVCGQDCSNHFGLCSPPPQPWASALGKWHLHLLCPDRNTGNSSGSKKFLKHLTKPARRGINLIPGGFASLGGCVWPFLGLGGPEDRRMGAHRSP